MHRLHEAIRRRGRLPKRTWMLAIVVIALIAGHGAILTYASSFAGLSMGAAAGLIILIVIKHLGVLAPIYALLRQRFRRDWQ